MVLNKDFKEFLVLLNEKKVKYLIVGGYAVALHGHPRYTKDLDIWVWVDKKNSEKIADVLTDFGFSGLSPSDFIKEGEFVQLGYPPNRIDIITSCEGLEFAKAYKTREKIELDGVKVNFLDLKSLIYNKSQVGRPQDLADVDYFMKNKQRK